MPTPQTPPTVPRRDTRDLRIKPEDALLDRTVFAVSPEAHAEFLARLDAPPKPSSRLKRALRTVPPWAA